MLILIKPYNNIIKRNLILLERKINIIKTLNTIKRLEL